MYKMDQFESNINWAMDQNGKTPEKSALVSPRGTETVTPKPERKRRVRHKSRERRISVSEVPGVRKLVLNVLTQKIIGCVVGEDVTSEKPWISINTELILDNIDLHSESSEFLPIKDEIEQFTGPEVLVGYIPDESRDTDEFYLCLTSDSINIVQEIIKKKQQAQAERLMNTINKNIKVWNNLGSDLEIDEYLVRNNRALIEVEIESKYPILPFKVRFHRTNAEDIRGGYMELRAIDTGLNIPKMRIDNATQVAPAILCNEAQTVCAYPTNSATQYNYEFQLPTNTDYQPIRTYIDKNFESLSNLLQVNGHINLYSNDYEDLVKNLNFQKIIKISIPLEYMSLSDVNLCKGKLISDVCWHCLNSELVAISYADIVGSISLTCPLKEDLVLRAIHGVNPVLLWSLSDDLKPKLVLEAHREVTAISFCPMNYDIIIGGCSNGQIIVWDIRNRLSRVEEQQVLTKDQQKYKEFMNSLMVWMKNIYDLSLVRPTAISQLNYSHKGAVSNVKWISPYYSVTKTGKLIEIDGGALQFMTSSEDGTILVWDLNSKPSGTSKQKARQRFQKLKRQPSGLLADLSPYKVLHLNLKPTYRINVVSTITKKNLSICSFNSNFINVTYEPKKNDDGTLDYVHCERVLERPNVTIINNFFVGSMEGEIIHAKWDGQKFDSGEVVNFEDCRFLNFRKYHDGPIVDISMSSISNTILTVGGRIFALWRQDMRERPFFWRRCKSIYTSGSWYKSQASKLRLVRLDGYVESWFIFYNSHKPIYEVLLSNGFINKLSDRPGDPREDVFGFGDHNGCLRLFCLPKVVTSNVEEQDQIMLNFISRCVRQRKNFYKWQDKWNNDHAKTAQLLKAEEPTEEDKKPETEAKAETVKKEIKEGQPVKRYLEMVKRDHENRERERIKTLILAKKQMDTEQLMKDRLPLQIIEEENELKLRKQRKRFRESSQIFRDTAAMWFPSVVKEKPPPTPSPYNADYSITERAECFENYQDICAHAINFVKENPFIYEFRWGNLLSAGKERRRTFNENAPQSKHWKRHQVYKNERSQSGDQKSETKFSKTHFSVTKFSETHFSETKISDPNVTEPS